MQTEFSAVYSAEVATYRQSLYSRLVRLLAIHLNQVHGEERSPRYWELLIGPWLLHFIYHAHHQYVRLDRSQPRAGRQVFFVPYDFDTFNIALDTTDYARQLDEILTSEVTANPSYWQPVYLDDPQLSVESIPSRPERLLKRALKVASVRLTPFALLVARVAMVSPSIRPPAGLRVWLASRFRVAPLFLPHLAPDREKVVVQPSLRIWSANQQPTGNHDAAPDEFEQLLHRVILLQMPVVHLEDYKRHRERMERLPARRLKVLFSAMSWHEEEAFKLLAANLMERGVMLVGHQHGGLYGIAEAVLPEYEQKVVDQFWTWGWTDSNIPSVRPFFSAKLSELRQKFDREQSRMRSRGDILLIATAGSRHATDGTGLPNGEVFVTYFQQQVAFLCGLHPEIRKDVVVRRHSSERYGWKQEEQVRDAGLDVTFRRFEPVATAFAHARLVIVDANLTSILEAYACDVPTVLVLDPKLWPLRTKWQDLFDAMEQTQLFHRSPKSAADFVNRISGNPREWWNSPSVVPTRERFRQTFARTSANFAQDLARALLAAAH